MLVIARRWVRHQTQWRHEPKKNLGALSLSLAERTVAQVGVLFTCSSDCLRVKSPYPCFIAVC